MMAPGRYLASAALLFLPACSNVTLEDTGLRIEDRPADGVVRVLNPSRTPARLYYNWANGFGGYQMFWIRFRDGAGNLVRINGGQEDGWWSPVIASSTSYGPGEWPPRRELVIPAQGFLDIDRDVGPMMAWIRGSRISAAGPCEIQIMLRAYSERRSWDRVELLTNWQRSACPSSS
jgi:hypothetical protein